MFDVHGKSPLRAVAIALFTASLMASPPVRAADPDPARFARQIDAFEKADREHPPAKGQILFLGSSSIRLWKLRDSFPTLDVLNRGFGGSIIADSVHYFPRIVLPYRPRQVVFYAGDNDIAGKLSPERVRDDFKKLVSLMHEQLPGTPLIYIAIKPSSSRWRLIEQIRAANGLIQAECEKDPLLTFLDIVPLMLDEQGAPRPELLQKDGLHMTPQGYEIWAEKLKPLLIPDQRSARLSGIYDADHPWTPPATLAEWETLSQQLREQVLVACGLWPMPEKTPLQPVIHGLIDRGDYTVERVYFSSLPGLYVTGNLYRPKHMKGPVPAVLCPHGHWPDGRLMAADAKTIAREIAAGAEQFASGASSPLQARMVELVRMGCVVFHYDMIGYADNGPLEHRGGFADADAALWLHHKLGLQTWNSIRALDFVLALPDVDSQRIGVTGASGGGTQTFLLSAIDPRVSVSFPAVMVSTGMQGGCICENADYLRVGLNNIAIAALTAPRPMAMSGANDWTIHIETKGYPELRQIYGLYGQADLVYAKSFPQFSHNYNQVSRALMLNWLNTHLQLNRQVPVQVSDYWPLTHDEMTVFDAEHPRPDDALDEPELREQLRKRDRQAFQNLLHGDADRYQKVVAGARRVLLPALQSDVNIELIETSSGKDQAASPSSHFVVVYDNARVPVTLLTPKDVERPGKVVLWLDGAGMSHVSGQNGQVDPAVQKLLDASYAVAAADLFLTGNEAGGKDLYSARFQTSSPAHVSKTADKEYTGFIYGYNRTPLAERARDIQAVVQALRKLGYGPMPLVGTGRAGVWALLAQQAFPVETVDQLVVDLQGFSFSGIKLNSDENMVPGALKYGGLGGLSASAFPASLTIYGMNIDHAEELAPLKLAYASKPELLKLSSSSLAREDVAGLLGAVSQ